MKTRQVKRRMTVSESGVHWLAGKVVEIIEWDEGEAWETPVVKVKCEGKTVWMNAKDLEPPPANSAPASARRRR